MKLDEREQELADRYSIIEDRHERLNAIIGHRLTHRELPEDNRSEEWLVRGCASQVWLKAERCDGKLTIQFAADSLMVKGLVALLVELYDGADLDEVRNFSPHLLEALELDRMLSGTRLNGLAQVVLVLKNAAHVD